jgi:hypothetical protein
MIVVTKDKSEKFSPDMPEKPTKRSRVKKENKEEQ